jgi:hypothetical protein
MAADGQTEPYLIYEWHAVEGLVRARGEDPSLKHMPGIQKVKDCIRDRVALSSARYLKTASVFGFHGVYRVLAENLDVVKDGMVGETGYELLTTWEREQGLVGFASGQESEGARWRDLITGAVSEAMTKGSVSRSPGWQGWKNKFG